jgi:anaerobic ribonucleoside-triphosphate reductase
VTKRPKVIASDKASDPTVNNLMVGSTTSFTNEEWDRKLIVDKLVGELGIKPETADTIAQAIEVKLADAGLETVTTAEIRTLVQAELLARGMRAKFKKGNLAVMSFHDLESLMVDGNQENSNVPHNPEAINLYIGENIVKQFALDSGRVFTPEVAAAHKDGYIHLHDLGLVERPYCSGNSPAFVIRHGLSSQAYTNPSKPAKHLMVLINHIKEFSSLLQGHFAGAIGWDAVNTFLSPFVNGLTDDQIMQASQDMILILPVIGD